MPDVSREEDGPMVVNNTFVQCEGHDREKSDTPVAQDKMDVLLEEQIREARRQYQEINQKYPYMDGGKTVLGPEIFANGSVLCWKGENYVPQEQVRALVDLRAVAGIHCGALGELFHDAGIEMPENALRLYFILLDELTLKLDALAKSHPAVMPRVPRGMK
jgi:hypothetical protein